MSQTTKKTLLEQRTKVQKEQKKLNKVVKKQQNTLKKQLKELQREIKQSDDIVLTKEGVNKMISKRLRKVNNEIDSLQSCCKMNKCLILISCIMTACGFVYLENNKKDN